MQLESFLAYSYALWQRGGNVRPHSEPAFRHLLGVERRRAEQSRRAVLIVLVSLRPAAPGTAGLSPLVAVRIFSGLAQSVREVDFIGWYRQSRIAGAVLAQGAVEGPDVSHRIQDRVRQAVCGRLPLRLHERVRVRVMRLRRG